MLQNYICWHEWKKRVPFVRYSIMDMKQTRILWFACLIRLHWVCSRLILQKGLQIFYYHINVQHFWYYPASSTKRSWNQKKFEKCHFGFSVQFKYHIICLTLYGWIREVCISGSGQHHFSNLERCYLKFSDEIEANFLGDEVSNNIRQGNHNFN